MARLQSSGTMSLSDIIFNRSDALPSTNGNYTFSGESNTFASGATVGDQDNYNNVGDLTDRNLLKAAPHSISEFYGANHPNSNFSSVVAKLSDGTDVSSNGYVDGETAHIYFTVDDDDGIGTSFQAGLKLKSDNSIVQYADATVSGEGSKYINLGTVNNIDADNDKYYAYVTNDTSPFIEARGVDINHYDDIASATVDAVSTATVANNSVQTTIEHGLSLGDNSSLNYLEWDFAKTSGDGSNPSPTDIDESSDTTPSVTYTGVGVFTAVCKAIGHPSEARNSRTSGTVTHRIEYTDFIECANPSTAQYNTEIDNNVSHRGFTDDGSETISYGLVSSSATTTFANGAWETSPASPRTLDSDSRIQARSFGIGITPADVQWTQYLQIRAVTDTGVSDNSNTFTYYPEIRSNRNVINPTSATIYSTTRNTDTSTYPTTRVFSSPSTPTDNVNAIQYYEYSNAFSVTANAQPSSVTDTQATITAGTTTTSGETLYLAISGSGTGGSTSQKSVSTSTITVNYSKEMYNLSTVAVGGANDTVNDNLVFSFSNQGFNLQSTRFELIEASDDTTQVGNDIDSTSYTGGGVRSTNTETVTLTSQASSFGNSTGGTYKIKVSLWDNGSHSGTALKTALTDAFTTYSITEFTSTFKGVDNGEGIFQGYASKLLAAENNSSTEGTANRTIAQAISGAKLFALNLNASSLVARNNDLSTAFNGNEESGQNFFNNDGSVIEINGSDGIIDSVTDDTPATLTVGGSEVSDSSSTITINITGNTEVTRTLRVSYTPSGGSESTVTVAPSSQTTSLNQNYQITSLTAGTTYAIKVRGENEAENGNYSNIVNFDTDAVVRTLATSDSSTADTVMKFTGTSFSSLHASRNKYSDLFVITVGNCLSNDQCIITTTGTGDNLTDFSVKLAANTDNGTSPWNTSTGAEVGTDVESSGAVTTSTARSITFTGLSAGTNTLTCRLRAEYDGSTQNAFSTEELDCTVTAVVKDSGGSTVVASTTMHTVTVTHLPIV